MPPAIIIPIAISVATMAASYAYQRFAQKPLSPEDRGFEIVATDPRQFIPVVYGTHSIGAHRVFTMLHPKHKNVLYVVADFCMGECDGIERIFFDDELVADFLDSPEDPIEEKWISNVNIAYRLGVPAETVYQDLIDTFGQDVWPSSSLGSGIVSVLFILTKDSRGTGKTSELFPDGLPAIRARVRGKKVQDIRKITVVENCQDVWTSATAGVSVSLGSGKVNTNSVKITVGGSVSANTLLAYETFSSINLSSYNALTFYIKADQDIVAGSLKLKLDSNSIPQAISKREVGIPALIADEWKRVIVPFDDSEDLANELTSIVSVGIYQVSDLGEVEIELDDINATVYAFQYKAGQITIDECDSAWNEQPPVSGVSVSTTTGRLGTGSTAARVTINKTNSTAAGTKLMSKALASPLNLAGGLTKRISFYIRSNIELKYGDLQFLLDDTLLCASPLETLKIPRIKKVDVWRKIELSFENYSALTAVRSIGIKQTKNLSKLSKQSETGEITETTSRQVIIDIDSVYGIKIETPGTIPSLCQADFLMSESYGYGLPISDLNLPTFVDGANFDSEKVSGMPISAPKTPKSKLMDKKYGKLSANSSYRYRLIYEQKNGTYSDPGHRTKAIKTTGNKRAVKLYDIDKSPYEDTTRIRIYRTKANGTKYYYLTYIANRTESYVDDDTSDDELTDLMPELGNASTSEQLRFTCNGVLDTSKFLPNNLEDLLTANRGNIFYEEGKVSLFTRKATSPESQQLYDDDFIGEAMFTLPGSQETANTIKATWQNRHKKYKPSFIFWPPENSTNPYLKEDNDIQITREMNLFFTTDEQMARQIALVSLKEVRGKIKFSATVKEKALNYQVGSLVRITYEPAGWSSKSFWVDSIGINSDNTCTMSFTEYNVNDYDYDTLTKIGSTDEDLDDDPAVDPNLGAPPPPVIGLKPRGQRGAEGHVFGQDFEWAWEGISKIESNFGDTTFDINQKESTRSQEGIRYKCEVKSIFPPDCILGGIPASEKVIYSTIVTEPEFTFSYDRHVQAMKNFFEPYPNNKYYNDFYGKPQRTLFLWVTAINEYELISPSRFSIATNGSPDMLDRYGKNISPGVYAERNSIRVEWPHPWQEYDISSFLVKLCEAYNPDNPYGSHGLSVLVNSKIWTANTLVKLNDLIYPTIPNGHCYVVTYAGKTGQTEPIWPVPSKNDIHPTVINNTVLFRHNTVYLANKVSSMSTTSSSDDDIATIRYSWVITQLDPKKDYIALVVPYDFFGKGNQSEMGTARPMMSFDDLGEKITYPNQVDIPTIDLIGSNTLKVSWEALSDEDIEKYIVDWRAGQGSGEPSLEEIEQGFYNIDNTKLCYGHVINSDKDSRGEVKTWMMIQDAKVGYTYWVRVRAENSSGLRGAYSPFGTHVFLVQGVGLDDVAFPLKQYYFTGTISAVDYNTCSWTSGLLKFKKSSGTTTTDYSITSGSSGNISEAKWLIWKGTGGSLQVVEDNELVTNGTYKDAVTIAYLIPGDTTKQKITILPSQSKTNTLISGSVIAADSIVANHIQTGAVKAVKIDVDSEISIGHDSGGKISIKDNNNNKRIILWAYNGGAPFLKISKAGHDADTNDPDLLTFDSRYNYLKITETDYVECSFPGASPIAAFSYSYQDIVVPTVNPGNTRGVTGLIGVGGGYVYPMPYEPPQVNVRHRELFSIMYDDSTSFGGQVIIRREMFNYDSSSWTPSSATQWVRWYLFAETIT